MSMPVGFKPNKDWNDGCREIKEKDPDVVRENLKSSLDRVLNNYKFLSKEQKKVHEEALNYLLVEK